MLIREAWRPRRSGGYRPRSTGGYNRVKDVQQKMQAIQARLVAIPDDSPEAAELRNQLIELEMDLTDDMERYGGGGMDEPW